jgi:hypothetical protein
MSNRVIDLNSYRKRRSKDRVFEALEQFQQEILLPLEEEQGALRPEEFEEFIVQLLGDHLVGQLESMGDIQRLDEQYRHFDGRLRKCLQTKLKSLAIFESVKKV